MMKCKARIAVVGVVISSAVGCAEPGVIESNSAGAIMGTGGAQPATSGMGAAGMAAAAGTGGAKMVAAGSGGGGSTIGSGGMGAAGAMVGSGGNGAGGAAGASTGGAGGAGSGGAGGAGDSGAGGAAGTESGGAGGSTALPACPSGWTCQDPLKQLTDLGAEGTVTDASGAPVKYACGTGDAVTCDMADPKGSCPALPNPFCAHVMVGGLLAADLYSCAQLCTP
jgi:hypothetical protein